MFFGLVIFFGRSRGSHPFGGPVCCLVLPRLKSCVFTIHNGFSAGFERPIPTMKNHKAKTTSRASVG